MCLGRARAGRCFGRSAKPGSIAMHNVPAGSHRLRVWHPRLPVGTPTASRLSALRWHTTRLALAPGP